MNICHSSANATNHGVCRWNIWAACVLALTGSALVATARPAEAHPHIWIDASVKLQFQGGKLTGMKVVWLFDEYYSAFVLEDFDANGNGRMDREELKVLEDGHEGMSEYGYFTHLRWGDELLRDPQGVEVVENFKAETLADGRLQYSFDVPLPEPLDPHKTRFAFGFYDESYYVDLNLGAIEAPRVTGDWPGGCRPVTFEDAENPIYFGMVNPLFVQVNCNVS